MQFDVSSVRVIYALALSVGVRRSVCPPGESVTFISVQNFSNVDLEKKRVGYE